MAAADRATSDCRRCAETPSCCSSLVTSALEGNHEAFEKLLDRFKRDIAIILHRLLANRSREDREDAKAEVQLHLWRRLQAWRREWPFCCFLRAVAANRTRDFLRGLTRRRPDLLGEQVDEVPAAPPRRVFSPEEKKLIERQIASFPERQRIAWGLRYEECIPVRQIAIDLGVSDRTVFNWLGQMLEAVKACLQ